MAGDASVRSGDKIIVDSNDSGDSYMTHNSTSHYVSVVVDGVEVARFKP